MESKSVRPMWMALALVGALTGPLAGCASRSPAVPLLRLPLVAAQPVADAVVAPPRRLPTQLPTQLLALGWPEYLDRESVWIGSGATLQAFGNWLWAEPLRDAVPRVLQQDLAALLGEGAVTTRLPAVSTSFSSSASATPSRTLRVEVLALEAQRDGASDGAQASQVVLQARWTVTTPAATSAAATLVVRSMRFSAPWTGSSASGDAAEALAAAHRQVLRQLAERIAADLR